MKSIITFILVIFLCFTVLAQKEANNWYFGKNAGISFETETPSAYINGAIDSWHGTASISDSLGNLLFYTDGVKVYNKNHQQMPNGYGLLGQGESQACVIVKQPNKEFEYFIFTVGCAIQGIIPAVGLYYSKVKMNLDNELGDVDSFYKNIPLTNSNVAVEKITALRHANGIDIWIIVRDLCEPVNQYHSYLVTTYGVNTQPIKSNCLNNIPVLESIYQVGQLKISPNGKILVAPLKLNYGGIEVGYFNNNTGEIELLFNFSPYEVKESSGPYGAEFSPDSRFVYLSMSDGNSLANKLMQYDLTLLPDKDAFLSSKVDLGFSGLARDLQLGPDGKIYIARFDKEYLGVINYPGLKGFQCGYDTLGVYLGGRICKDGLPQFIQSYFLRFEFEGKCAGVPFDFSPNFNPVPDSIHWDFGDPVSGDENYSSQTNPQHIFMQGGDYTVTAFVRYPGGRTETASRVVPVATKPSPYPGQDTIVCKNEVIALNAVPGFSSYLWITGDTTTSISVADSGTYWVEAVNAEGCTGRDSVEVGYYPEPELNDQNTVVSPTTCGNSVGAIRGLLLSGGTLPYRIQWLDNDGNTVDTTLDIINLPVGNYHLWVTDGSGCTIKLAQYQINNYDSDLIIEDAVPFDVYCNQSTGRLEITVKPGLSDMLVYSVDNGVTYSDNQGHFDGLMAKEYYIKVKDSEDCEAVYAYNPVKIQSKPGLRITNSFSSFETGNDANGTITIQATGDSLLYAMDGWSPQDTGLFTGLTHGFYTILVTDKHGCDSTVMVEVKWESGDTLSAIAGNAKICEGFRAKEPIMVRNFKDISSFEITLNYNTTLLEAESYDNELPELQAGLQPIVYPSNGLIKIKWTGTSPLSLPDNTVLLDLIMKSKTDGLSTTDWVMNNSATYFLDPYGNTVSVNPEPGIVEVSPGPSLWPFFQDMVCENSEMSQMAIPGGGTGINTVIWETPSGTTQGAEYRIESAKLSDAGMYRVMVVDELNCKASDSVNVTVIPTPQVHFPYNNPTNDTIFYEQQYLLEATPGYAGYEWNTGDTTFYLKVTEEGTYSVIIQTAEGCTNTGSVVMTDVWLPFEIPNAFTPNGDGLNDTFRPVVDFDRVRQFNMVIYNKWGQRIFESTNPIIGWDGKDALTGIYSWIISYANRLGKEFKLKGNVAVVR